MIKAMHWFRKQMKNLYSELAEISNYLCSIDWYVTHKESHTTSLKYPNFRTEVSVLHKHQYPSTIHYPRTTTAFRPSIVRAITFLFYLGFPSIFSYHFIFHVFSLSFHFQRNNTWYGNTDKSLFTSLFFLHNTDLIVSDPKGYS